MIGFAGIDVGTGGCRCLIVGETGARLAYAERRWRYESQGPGVVALDPQRAVRALDATCREALSAAGARVAAVGVTSQRTGVVFLDARGEVLLISPNTDGRAVAEGTTLERAHGDAVYRVAGRLPVMLYLPARLAWLRAHRPDVANRVATVLSLADWVGLLLDGERATERSQAAEMLVSEVARGDWSDEMCGVLGVPRAILPRILERGAVAGAVRAAAFGFDDGTAVVRAGTDTQCALVARGAVDEGALGVVAGTTMLAGVVSASATPDPQRRLWLSPHAVGDRWVAEAHCGEAGAALEWVASVLGMGVTDAVDAARAAEPGSGGVTFHDAWPGVASDFPLLRRGSFQFPVPLLALGRGRPELARAALEGIAFGARAALAWLEERSGAREIALAGGLARAEPFVRALAGAAERPVSVPAEQASSALGAAIAAAATHHRGIADAVRAMADIGTMITPRAEDGYPAHYAEWLRRHTTAPEAFTVGQIR